MNPNIRDIIEFTSEPQIASLVSRSWREEVLENERNIVEGLRREYEGLELAEMPLVILVDDNIEAMQRLALVRSAVNWDEYAYLFLKGASIRMIRAMLPYFNITNQVILAGRRGIPLSRYPSLLLTDLEIPDTIKGIGKELYWAMLLGDVNLFTRIMNAPSTKDYQIEQAVVDFTTYNGVIPPLILDAIMYRFVDSGRYSSNKFSEDLELARRLIRTREDPTQYIQDSINMGEDPRTDIVDWFQIYLAMILNNDDVELFRQVHDALASPLPFSNAFMGGRKIVRYILLKPDILDDITQYLANENPYQDLDLQYFTHDILLSDSYYIKHWLKEFDQRLLNAKYKSVASYLDYIRSIYYTLAKNRGWTYLTALVRLR